MALARRVGIILGIGLLAAAMVLAWQQRGVVAEALAAMQDMSASQRAGLLATLIGSVVMNFALTGLLFSALMSRYAGGRSIGFIEMQAVMASSTLLNFVPLRPGLLSRVAYHRLYNRVAVVDSAKVVVQSAMFSAASAAYLVLIIAAFRYGYSFGLPVWALAVVPLPVLVMAWLLVPRRGVFAVAAALRLADLLVMAVRYWAAFALIGSPIDTSGALAFACLSVFAMMVPFLSNGLGLREWAVGVAAPLLTAYQMTLGITADLLNRAAEIVITVPAGLIGLAILAHVRTRRGA